MNHPAQQQDRPTGAAPALEAVGLGLQYRRRWALRDCDLRLPSGRVCALVGPNGAGKSTLMALAAGLLAPTEGSVTVFGNGPREAGSLRRMAYLRQDKPLYPRFTVAETLRAGRELNPGWDQAIAERIVRLGDLPLDAKVGTLTAGQRTRVAFALVLGKRPDLLMLDEPLADVDPVARQELTGILMAEAAEHGTTILISSHVLAELDGVCDHVTVLRNGRIRLSSDVEDLLDDHRLVVGAAAVDSDGAPPELAHHEIVELRRTGRQTTALLKPSGAIDPRWDTSRPNLEDILIAYLRTPDPQDRPAAGAGAQTAGRATELTTGREEVTAR
ncbi:ABC transporter ATP-binding protein [Kitasatospora paracochleata]|uniref:ABC-2 type transport system ATP-binding protein n=1 Tax=Kitasatospora paracochleata TaxID=58354 RepID=A0ABT1IZW1_9ACTN|nr:ABC transporter ATP-binding protein [Kitasatospora paracochleata]MCP2310564.1 ABC-2 type transport system ATP-binding protein [Kitasatospora paracochleata]